MKWVEVGTAPDQLMAEMWRDMLVDEGIPATIKPGDTTSFLGLSTVPCRVLVPEDRLEEAMEVLGDLLQ